MRTVVTKTEVREMRRLFKSGRPISDIAKAMKRSPSTVWAWCRGHMKNHMSNHD